MPLNIISAVYAGPRAGLDVTLVCQGIVDTGNDDIAVNNDTFTDPDPGEKKLFTIGFTTSTGGAKIYRSAFEGDNIDLVS